MRLNSPIWGEGGMGGFRSAFPLRGCFAPPHALRPGLMPFSIPVNARTNRVIFSQDLSCRRYSSFSPPARPPPLLNGAGTLQASVADELHDLPRVVPRQPPLALLQLPVQCLRHDGDVGGRGETRRKALLAESFDFSTGRNVKRDTSLSIFC